MLEYVSGNTGMLIIGVVLNRWVSYGHGQINEAGIYYLAAFSLAIVNRRSPVGAVIPAAIENNIGVNLQQLAWQYVAQYLARFRPKSMANCRQIMVDQICPRYFTITDRTGDIPDCVDWMNNTSFSPNSFNCPDPNLIVCPEP